MVFYRRDEQNKETDVSLLQTDTEDRAGRVNILLRQVWEQTYNNKTKASPRVSSLISLWNILPKDFYGNLNCEHGIYVFYSHDAEKEYLHGWYKEALIYEVFKKKKIITISVTKKIIRMKDNLHILA